MRFFLLHWLVANKANPSMQSAFDAVTDQHIVNLVIEILLNLLAIDPILRLLLAAHLNLIKLTKWTSNSEIKL